MFNKQTSETNEQTNILNKDLVYNEVRMKIIVPSLL